jgi:hypothetical protein
MKDTDISQILFFLSVAVRVTDSMQQSPWEASSRSGSQETPCLLWSPNFHYVFITARHWSLSWARWIQSTLSDSLPLRVIWMLSFDLQTYPPVRLLPSSFPTKILQAFLSIPVCATWLAHLIVLGLMIQIIICKSINTGVSHYPVFPVILLLPVH